MTGSIQRKSSQAGPSSEPLVSVEAQKTAETQIAIFTYDEAAVREEKTPSLQDCFAFASGPAVTWVNISGVRPGAVMEKIGSCFGLHPLVVEDILTTDHRPKLEAVGEDLFLVLKYLNYDLRTGKASAEQVSLILRENAVLCFQEAGNIFAPVEERLRSGKGRLRHLGPDYLVYTLLDIIVDRYFVILEHLGERIEALEEKVITHPSPQVLQAIQKLKREMISLRRWIWPFREVISGLQRGESPLVKAATGVYFRDVYDHTIQVIETVEVFRDMLSGMLDIYLSSISNRVNGVMKVLTIITTIFMPLTFIAGIYGMNFAFMPELQWRFGYPAVLLAMVVIVIFMLRSFKRKGWF
jgi:magnesium transporter